MKRSQRAPSPLRAVALAAALALPLAVAPATASSASRGSISYSNRAILGTLTIDGRCYQIRDGYCLNTQIRQALCSAGYDARIVGRDIVVYTRGCRQPDICWTGCDYDLQTCWRGTNLVLTLARINRHVSVRHYTPPPTRVTYVSTPVVRKYDTYRPPSWGCSTPPRSGVTIISGSSRNDSIDRGWGRRWDDSCDTGFNVRIDVNNRRR